LKARLHVQDGLLVVRLDGEYQYVSTLPPGAGTAREIAFIHVDKDYRVKGGLKEALEKEAAARGLPPGTPVFLTAADVGDPAVVEGDGFTMVATIGLSPPTCPGGGGRVSPPIPATINVLVAVHEPLEPSGAHDLLRTVAEAKAAAAWEAMLRCSGDPPHRPVGTVSDAVLIAWRPGPGGAALAGHNTVLGSRVGLAVYKAVVERGMRDPYWHVERATGRGLEELARTLPGPREASLRVLGELFSDPVVAALLVAARELDVRAASGTLPRPAGREAWEALALAAAAGLGVPAAGGGGFVGSLVETVLAAARARLEGVRGG